jgi:tRNA (guanine37-N1)-methyltransferase
MLQATLPTELLEESPSSFTITGHLGASLFPFDAYGRDAQANNAAHFNLREEYLPWKHLIGQIVLDVSISFFSLVSRLLIDAIDRKTRTSGLSSTS